MSVVVIRTNPVRMFVSGVWGIVGFMLQLNRIPLAPVIVGFELELRLELTPLQVPALADGNIPSGPFMPRYRTDRYWVPEH